MSSCSQYLSRNFMQKKALKTNQVVAQNAEEPANSNVMVTVIPVTEKSVKCLRLFALPVVKIQPFHLSLPVKDQFIAGIVSKLDAIAN